MINIKFILIFVIVLLLLLLFLLYKYYFCEYFTSKSKKLVLYYTPVSSLQRIKTQFVQIY